MNLIVTPNYTHTTNLKTKNKYNTVQFKGGVGEELLRKGFDSLNPETCKKAAQGTFGLSTKKVTDIFDSFIQTGKSLATKLSEKTGELNAAQKLIADFPKEKEQAVRETESKFYESMRKLNEQHKKEIAEKDAEIAELKKYEGMAKVKSVEEVGCIMPEEVMTIMDEATGMRIKAHKSMESFLFEGKGQEDAIVYLNKMAKLHKAYQDKLFDIKDISDKNEALRKEGIYKYGSPPVRVAIDMIIEVMTTSDKAQWLKVPKIKEQVNTNAIKLLETLCDKCFWENNAFWIQKDLNESLSNNVDYKVNYLRGLEKVKNNDEIVKVEEHIVPYNWRASYITKTYTNGYTEKTPADYVVGWGKNDR